MFQNTVEIKDEFGIHRMSDNPSPVIGAVLLLKCRYRQQYLHSIIDSFLTITLFLSP